jgi:hypothetical protein
VSDVDESPQFQHDCERCTFLGRLEVFVIIGDTRHESDEATDFDLYHCAEHPGGHPNPNVIARYGGATSDFVDGVDLVGVLLAGKPHGGVASALAEAMRRALAKGLPLQ